MQLAELIQHCTNQGSQQYQQAWHEFIARYKTAVYSAITKRCLSWNAPRLRRQLSDVVNDISAEVFVILYKSLATFKETENERKFIIWLTTISNRAVSHYMQRYFLQTLSDFDITEFQDLMGGVNFDSRWELYEFTVKKMRAQKSVKKKNLERDINIFLMYIWSDFSDKMVLTNPCYQQLGHRVIDNVVGRMRSYLEIEKKPGS